MKKVVFLLLMLSGTLLFGQKDSITLSELDSLTEHNEPTPKPLEVIEHVPLYKGCKKHKSNTAKKDCMSQKIAKLFAANFNTVMHEDSNIDPGMKRIAVIFKVDKDGSVIDIRARAEDEYLEAEAIRVAKLIPKLTPGMQRGKPVIVPYSLPLNVNLKANKNQVSTKYPVYRGCDKTSNNEELEKCSKTKIMNFIKLKFDYDMADRLFPTEQSTQFQLDFIINEKGKVEQVNAKANHKAVAIHVIRLAKQLPKFKSPGMSNGLAVDTPFSLLMTVYFQ